MTDLSLCTAWTDALADGRTPEPAALRGHLRAVHHTHPGFTEECASDCRDAKGRTSYAWLLETVDPQRHGTLLDLACGSGPLLALCDRALPASMRLIGLDMSPDELALAAARLPAGRARLIEGQAQRLDMLDDGSVDIVLCHWALTLMDPVTPVLAEIARILSPGGRFAAIVDGPMDSAPGYKAVHDLIYAHVGRALPAYGRVEMGDPRVRGADALAALIREVLPRARVLIEPNVVSMTGPPEVLSRETAGFFYASLILTPDDRGRMLEDLTALLADDAADGPPTFAMPVNRVTVDLP
jgi:ubiquinone/menaquinone biosynthesis C-methylase UbiE